MDIKINHLTLTGEGQADVFYEMNRYSICFALQNGKVTITSFFRMDERIQYTSFHNKLHKLVHTYLSNLSKEEIKELKKKTLNQDLMALSVQFRLNHRKIDELHKNLEEIAYRSEIIRQNLTLLDA